MEIKHPKKRGEWAEAQFLAKAAALGQVVSRPWGDSNAYDFVVESNGRFLKVQVKATISPRHRKTCCAWACCVHPTGARRYTADEIDFLAAYIIPEDVWYIFPGKLIAELGYALMTVSPSEPGHRWEPYREAWHLLR
jgi:hypothetical protein